ncbi:MAG: efflux RND transporter permease subunit [Phyllobacteriaceae bacterium]|nr:efflux RND transporter permease subunit [Phyllobacteriaceae bacterium]
MPQFFIHRPVFAWVLAIVTLLAGVFSYTQLPVSQYPDIAPTTVRVSASYSGATATAVENSVTAVLEDAMTGLDGLLYMESSSREGSASISLTFDESVDPVDAQNEVQSKVSQVESRLPSAVSASGVSVSRSSSSILMIGAIVSRDARYSTIELGDILDNQIAGPVQRTEGVGGINSFGSGYALRVWLDPLSLAEYQLTPADITAAISAQNTTVSVGTLGALPVVEGQQFTATITAQSQLSSLEEFENILLKTDESGAQVLLGDVAEVEIGQESYGGDARFNGANAAGFGVNLATGANAVDTANAVRATLAALEASLPEGVEIEYAYDTSPFVELSIEKVYHTLAEAIVLVFFVILVFLQKWRATLIPILAVPVVLAGTFAVLSALGYSINTLTMFAMVLAIGLLVDDAIVVVENVERVMEDEGLEPLPATEKSMRQITGALIGIALVLSAVFVPMAFFGGSTGVIYQQFSITIVSAMALSVLVALTLTPALCATLLRRRDAHHATRGPLGWFNRAFDATSRGYGSTVQGIIRRPLRIGLIYLALVGAMGWTFLQTPTGFLPDEDQGILFTLIQAPTGATAERTQRVVEKIEKHFQEGEAANVDSMFGVVGFSFAGQGQNMGIAFVRLKDWDERPSAAQSVQAVAGRGFAALSQIRDALVFPIVPPSVIELGNVSGFDFYLQARGGQSHEELLNARNALLGMAAQSPLIGSARPSGLEDAAQYRLDIDWQAAGAMGVSATDVGQLLSVAWAGSYINDYVDQGRIKRVYIQGEADSRATPEDISQWRVRNASGGLVPFSNFAEGKWTFGPQGLSRYNGVPAMQIQGSPAPGVTTGEAMAEVERLVGQLPGFNVAWTGLSLEEQRSGNQAPLLYALSLAVVFLCLAALYESWSIPFAVMLAMPIGVLGALLWTWLGGYQNGVFFQVGLLTVIGLTGKNAILIVEFARERYEAGEQLFDAVREAARQRFRPIIMTSMAFSLGVLPLVLSTGAGSGGRNAIGTSVLGGTLSATVLGVLFVPLFFVLVTRRRKQRAGQAEAETA